MQRAYAAENEPKQMRAGRRGRKAGHAGRAELEARWDEMEVPARRRAMIRHTHDIAQYLEKAAADWEPSAFARALEWLDLVPDLLSTRPSAAARMEFAKELIQ
eukprot:3908866-Pleurochrysis_carterae.AAC.1